MVLQLYRTGLYLRYPIFFVYFIFRIPNSIWPFFLGVSTGVYQQVWVLTEPIDTSSASRRLAADIGLTVASSSP